MTIMVRVVSNRAQAQLAALRATQNGLTGDIAKANRMTPLGSRHITSLMKFGNQLQWTGRMLQYNFTIPIMLAGAAATHFALEQDKAMTHVAKVYGDTQDAAKQFRREMGLGQAAARKLAESYRTDELEALDDAFTAISAHYGVQKKEVLEVAGAWAAAGASGLALAESVNTTMKAIIIGDMNAMEATKALISIQAQYNLNTEQLMSTLANLNSVENQTGASMNDLIIGFEKAAGVARSAGIETSQLAAYMAALVPATGSAATAGNALKTIISRLMSPTKEAKQVMEAMGLEVTAMSWQSLTATDRLKLMAKEFSGLGSAAQSAAASVIASRWQVNRFEVLMRELVSTTGYYQKALDAAEDKGASFTRMQKELNTVLESDPRRMQRMLVMLQNASVEIIQPLIPHILYLVNALAKMAQAFSDLDPHVQKFVLLALLALAAVGPLVRYTGALTTLFGVIGHGTLFAVHGMMKLVGWLGFLLMPFKMLGTVAMGAMGLISSAVVAMLTAVTSLFTGAFALWAGIATRGWAIQVAIWRAGIALQMINMKLLVAAWRIFMVTLSLAGITGWTKMWVIMKTVTVAALGAQAVFLTKFATFFTKLWALTATVTTRIWGRMLVGMLLLSKTFAVTMMTAFKAIIPFLIKWGKWMVSWPALLAAAVIGILYTFRSELIQVWENIVGYFSNQSNVLSRLFYNMGDAILSVFNMLPQGVQNAMVAVVTVIRDAALAVYDWFQYINPFAHHSPSLVENVENGMQAVVRSFSNLSNIKKYTSAAYAEIKRFGELTAKIGLSAQANEQKDNRKAIKKAGGGGEALKSYDKLIATMKQLTPILQALEGRMNAQQKVVDRWSKKLDEANRRVDNQTEKLDRLKNKLSEYQAALDAAQNNLDYYASAPLEGMRAMEDQIFSNQMAQNKLRLEMMKLEDVNGTFDDIKSKMEAISGAQELLRGTQADLRTAGAGSEILGFYDDEIKKLEDQKGAYSDSAKALFDMQAALDKLTREAEMLDLTKSLKFDELTRQIEQAADRTKELSFDEIMAGIAGSNAEIDKWTPLVEKATAAVAEQQTVVDEAIAKRDEIQKRLDQEQATLDLITDKYNAVNDAIRAIEQSIGDVVSAAEKMNDALEKKKEAKKKGAEGPGYISPGLQNFLDAGDADFPDPGGKGIPPRSDWTSQADDIKKFTEQLGLDTAAMFEQLNPFTPLKDKALKAWDWIKGKAKDAVEGIKGFFSAAFDGVDFGGGDKLDSFLSQLEGVGEFITGVFKDIGKGVKAAWDLLGPDIMKIGSEIWDALQDAWDEVGPKLAEFGDLIEPLGEAIKGFWEVVKPILALLAGGFLAAAKILLSVISQMIGPAIKNLAKIFGGIIDVIKGVLKILIGIFTGDWKMMWDGVTDIVGGAFSVIWGIIKGAGQLIWAVVEGVVKGIWGFFVWLYDILVGHSVVPDLMNAIIDTFHWLADLATWVWDKVLKPIYDFFVDAYELVIAAVGLWWDGVKAAWNGLTAAGTWFWNNILKPVWGVVKDVWDKNIEPALSLWWEGVKIAWALLKGAGVWFWQNILKPVWETVKDVWDKNIEPALRAWWEGIKLAWGLLIGAGMWFWTNVLQPVWQTVKDLWQVHVKPGLEGWWEGIKTAWSALTGIATWVQKNVLDPVKNAFTGTFGDIKQWFLDNSEIFKKPVEAIVNIVITAVNAIITGLNKVADILPGIDWDIDTIPGLASGGPMGRRASRGFMTNGARAIVGEGKANYPEFVIPTDPTHRSRAKSLMAMAAQKMGLDAAAASVRNSTLKDGHGIPMYDAGGWLKDKWNSTKGIAKSIANLHNTSPVSTLMNPILNTGQKTINGTSWTPPKVPPTYAIKELRQWAKDADTTAQKIIDAMIPGGGNVPVGDPDNPTGGANWKGGWFTNRFIAHMEKAEELVGSSLQVIQGGFRPYSSYSGTSHQADAIDFQVNNSLIGAMRRVGIAAGDRTGLGDWDPHSHAIPGPSAGTAGGSAVWQWQDYIAKGGMSQPLNSAWGLKDGAIIKGGRGGVNAKIGEGSGDELVTPLPSNWKTSGMGGDKTYHFYGDLSFPNITTGDDVELFLQNLDNVTED